MNLYIKSARIIDPNSKYHNQIMDIYIENDTIKNIAKNIKIPLKKSKEYEVFSAKNLHVSPGWFDLHVNFGDPGFEYRETLITGTNAAAYGGYTGVLIMPNTKPFIDNIGLINYIKNKTNGNVVDVFPAGNITNKCEGNEIVEMHDMKKAGCLAFTDDKDSIDRHEIMKIALQYSKDCDTLIMNFPNNKSLSIGGTMHEGEISIQLGLKGIPSISEEITLNRDIRLCEYTNSKLHISYISTKESTKIIKEARRKGIQITSDVNIYNLFLTDNCVNNFDTRYKVLPPLRSLKDSKALIKALKENIIDVITTDHTPQENEDKKIDFIQAKYGIIGLETSFGLLGKYILPHLGITELINKIAINPRKILNIDIPSIKENKRANLTLFDPEKEWVFKKENIKSKSNNTPFISKNLRGKALAIYNNNQFIKCSNL